jgi:hypothetical protein
MTPKAIELWKQLYVYFHEIRAGRTVFCPKSKVFFVGGFGAGSLLDPGKTENCEKKFCKQGYQIWKKEKNLNMSSLVY